MIETINANLEKAFLIKILNEPDQFYKVKPHFNITRLSKYNYKKPIATFISHDIIPLLNCLFQLLNLSVKQ